MWFFKCYVTSVSEKEVSLVTNGKKNNYKSKCSEHKKVLLTAGLKLLSAEGSEPGALEKC